MQSKSVALRGFLFCVIAVLAFVAIRMGSDVFHFSQDAKHPRAREREYLNLSEHVIISKNFKTSENVNRSNQIHGLEDANILSKDADVSEVINDKSQDAGVLAVVNDKSTDANVSEHVNDKSKDANVSEHVNDKSKDASLSQHVNDKSKDATLSQHVNDKSKDATLSQHVNDKSKDASLSQHVNDKLKDATLSQHVNDKSKDPNLSQHVNDKSKDAHVSEHINNKSKDALVSANVSDKSEDVSGMSVHDKITDQRTSSQAVSTQLKPGTRFQHAESEIEKLLQQVNSSGSHSDFIGPRCKDSKGVPPNLIKVDHGFVGPFKYLPNYKNPCYYNGTKQLICIPYFYLVGTVKSGTTDLFSRIQMHPQVAKSWPWEKRWFDRVRFKNPDAAKFTFYANKFRSSTQNIEMHVKVPGYHHMVIGDDSPSALFGNNFWKTIPGNEWCQEPRVIALSHIHHLNPSAKLILIARNPTDRLYSDYLFNTKVTHGNATAEQFHERASRSVETFRNCTKHLPFRRCLYGPETFRLENIFSFTSGIYSRLVLDTWRIFPRELLLIIQSEDYKDHLRERLKDVFRFLELDPLSVGDFNRIANRGRFNEGSRYKKSGTMFPETRKMLDDFYGPFNEELAFMLKDEKFLWRRKPNPTSDSHTKIIRGG